MSTFGFNGLDLRVVLTDDQPWFVAADVCKALDLTSTAGSGYFLRHLHDEEKRHILKSTITVGDVSFPNRGALCISESGLYKLIMRSDKAEAARFQDWVTQDVLPTIRKTGAYVMGEEKVAQGLVTEDQMAGDSMAGPAESRKRHRLPVPVKSPKATPTTLLAPPSGNRWDDAPSNAALTPKAAEMPDLNTGL